MKRPAVTLGKTRTTFRFPMTRIVVHLAASNSLHWIDGWELKPGVFEFPPHVDGCEAIVRFGRLGNDYFIVT